LRGGFRIDFVKHAFLFRIRQGSEPIDGGFDRLGHLNLTIRKNVDSVKRRTATRHLPDSRFAFAAIAHIIMLA